jgi:hypothetical protein
MNAEISLKSIKDEMKDVISIQEGDGKESILRKCANQMITQTSLNEI